MDPHNETGYQAYMRGRKETVNRSIRTLESANTVATKKVSIIKIWENPDSYIVVIERRVLKIHRMMACSNTSEMIFGSGKKKANLSRLVCVVLLQAPTRKVLKENQFKSASEMW